MNIFQEVKERANILQVCDLLGIKLDRNNKCLCIFHKENTPSFSIHPQKNIFSCFGCGKTGDVIKLVEEALNISAFESAKYLNDALGLGIEINSKSYVNKSYVNKFKQKRQSREKYLKCENETFQLLCDYWKALMKDKEIEDPEDEVYIEACKKEGYISYLIDEIFIYGTDEDKLWFRKYERKVVEDCERKLGRRIA